jgi:hypothetical protein
MVFLLKYIMIKAESLRTVYSDNYKNPRALQTLKLVA